MAQLIGKLDDDLLYREYRYARWLAREAAAFRVVRMLGDQDRTDELEQIAGATQAWLGPMHPRVSTTFHTSFMHGLSSSWSQTHLRVVVDDERGPAFADAAAALTDPSERERWCVAQVIGLCDAITALRMRAPEMKLLIGHDDLFVDLAGHAKLKAPAPHVDNGRASTRAGGPPPRSRAGFLSPEQCSWRANTTPASDVYVLASHLYCALAGRFPFDDENTIMMLMMIVQQPAAPISTRVPGLDRIIERAMDKQPEARYPDTAAFAGELRRCVPDAADYDAVISDRIVAWRATRMPA